MNGCYLFSDSSFSLAGCSEGLSLLFCKCFVLIGCCVLVFSPRCAVMMSLMCCVVCVQVRTTAPEKYRVKPSNSSCEPGASVDIVVSLHGGE